MSDKLTERLSEEIAETTAHFPYPETPDIAGAVQQRLMQQPAQMRPLRWAVVGAFLLVLLVMGLLAIPPVRATMVEWLRIGAIEIFVMEEVPAMETAVPLSITDLGEAISLADAQAIYPEPLRLPEGWEPESLVYSQQFLGRLPVITIQWQTANGVTVTLSQIAAPYLGMKWASGEQVVETAVHGQPAVWIEGPHPLQFSTGDFDMQLTVDSNVLIWTEGTITYRLEGEVDRETAVSLAESLP